MKFVLALLFSGAVFAATNTSFNPDTVEQFSKGSQEYKGQKSFATVSAGETLNIDFIITEDTLITGARVHSHGACEADEIKFQVLSGSNVVTTFIDWYIMNENIDKDLTYPAKLTPGLTVRAIYKNTCLVLPTNVYINYYMHKVKN